MSTPAASEIRARAVQMAEAAAANARGLPYDVWAKVDILVDTLAERMAYEVSLGLDPLSDTLEDLMPGLDFDSWMPMKLAIRRRAQRLVADNYLFPEGTADSPDIIRTANAVELEHEVVKRMSYLAELGIDPLQESWEALLPTS
jgi:hypothetical protein